MELEGETDFDKEPYAAHRKHPRTGRIEWCVVQGKKATRWYGSRTLAWKAWDERKATA